MTMTQQNFPQVSAENLIQKLRFDNKVSELPRGTLFPMTLVGKYCLAEKDADIHRYRPNEGLLWGNSMVAKPDVSISADEPHQDAHGQSWSPAKVTLTWPEANQLPGPSIQISLIAAVRGQMTVDELRAAHMQAAHDVLSAALLSIETPAKAHRVKRGTVQG